MIEYCLAERKHLVQILDLYRQLNPEDEPFNGNLDKIWDKIIDMDIKYFIAMDDGKLVSTCYLVIIPNLSRKGRSIGFIENVVTDIEYRRKGIGKKVMTRAMAYAKELNCYKVILQSGSKRKEAHNFYESLGFDGDSKRAFEKRL